MRSGRIAAIAAVIICLVSIGIAAQQGKFRAGVELVSLNVTVMEGTKYVTGLQQEDFEVYEDGAKQTLSFFSAVQQPIAQPFTNDVNALERAIRQTTVNGSTSLYNAIYVSLRGLKDERAKNAEEIRRQAIVVLSDGDDTSSVIEYDDVLDLAKRSETAIYAIGLRTPETGRGKFKEAEFVLRQLSQETGGRVFFPTSIAELPKIYEQISEELAS